MNRPPSLRNSLRQVARTVRATAWIAWMRTSTVDFRYSVARAIRFAKLHLRSSRNPILVFTMGKVGSSTLARSLSPRDIQRRVTHVHYLTPERLDAIEEFHKVALRKHAGTSMERVLYPHHVWRGRYIAQRLGTFGRDEKVKVITLVRDPIAKTVAAFFENLRLFFGYDYESKLNEGKKDEITSDLKKLFYEHYVKDLKVFEIDANPLTWMDEELKATFGVDVFASPFPREQGYKIYSSHNAEVLLIRLEDLNRCAASAVNELLGVESFKMVTLNKAENKIYASLYKDFLDNIALPDSYLDFMYDSKMAKHFYSADELAGFRRRWSQQ